MDDEGTATAVWRQAYQAPDGTRGYSIQAARRGPGGRWSTPRIIGCRRSACPGSTPQVGVDAKGTVTAAWSTGKTITVARRPATGPWRTPRVIATTTGTFDRWNLDVAVARNGAVFVVWKTAWDRVRAAHRTAGGTWQAQVRLGGGDAEVSGPTVGISATGAAVVTFADTHGDVIAARFGPGRGWGKPTSLGHSMWPGSEVAVGPGGRALVVWTPGNPEEQTKWITAREMDRHGVWGPARRISGTSPASDIWPAPVIDSAGTETVAYLHNSVIGMVARKPVGGTWTRTSVGRGGGYDPMQLVVNRGNDLAAAFGPLALRPHGSGWSAPAPGRGVIAILPRGSALRMWRTTAGLVAQRLHVP